MTAKEKLTDRNYMANVHRGHAGWWKERIASGELDERQMTNASDMIRIHEAHAANLEKEQREGLREATA